MSTKNKTVKEKIEELGKLVEWFDGEDFELETATDKFKAAKALSEEIEKDLNSLKNDINVVKEQFDK
jgi:exonuclease VII small subunit